MLPFFALGFGPGEIAIIVVIVILLFGGKKLPELAKGLGEGIKEFKKATKQSKTDDDTNETKKED